MFKYLNILLLLFLYVNSIFAVFPDSSKANEDNYYLRGSINSPLKLSDIKDSGQKFDPFKYKLNTTALIGVGAVTLGAGVGVHIYQANAWWQNQSGNFKIQDDWKYAIGIDKIGHFYGSNLISHVFSAGLEAGNVDIETATILSAAGGFAFQMYVEILDGFGPQWGFSPSDALFDFLGSAYFVSQYYFPLLKNIQPRFSWIPTEAYRNGTHKGNLIDDYEGQIYWLAFRMKQLLPQNAAKYWPSFLMLSLGAGVRNLDGSGAGNYEFFVGLDLDAEEIPLYGGFWQFVKNTLNYFHFPMPGIRITPNTAFFVFLF